MRDRKKKIVEALATKQIKTVNLAKQSSVNGGRHNSANLLIICG